MQMLNCYFPHESLPGPGTFTAEGQVEVQRPGRGQIETGWIFGGHVEARWRPGGGLEAR